MVSHVGAVFFHKSSGCWALENVALLSMDDRRQKDVGLNGVN